jgi:hypothetical protein
MDRFNFYDLYGYLLPGLITLGLLAFPFRLVADFQLPSEWSGTFVALVCGYIVGHLLQMVATPTFSYTINGRPPSAIYLDNSDKTFTDELKSRLAERVKAEFGIDVKDGSAPDDATRDRRRRDAFFLCRRSLIQEKLSSYAETFEGLYALMRGVTAACVLGAVTHVGWVTAALLPPHSDRIIGGVLLAVFALLALGKREPKWKRLRAWAFYGVALLCLTLGVSFGTTYAPQPKMEESLVAMLVGITLFLLFVARRTYADFRRYAGLFVETVYRDYCARPVPKATSS